MKYEIQIIPQGEVTTTNRDWEIAIVRANALHGQIAISQSRFVVVTSP